MKSANILATALLLYLNSTTASSAPEAAVFTGHWEKCYSLKPETVCDSFTLMSNGENVCGTWTYWATSHYYYGRLIAKAQGTKAQWLLTCGDEGHRAKNNCPGEYASPDAQWGAAEGRFLICGSNLYSIEPGDELAAKTSCASVRHSPYGMKKAALKAKMKTELMSENWMANCLNGANPTVHVDSPPAAVRR
jgi:hypothetical protein